ncbi:[Myosin heavy-chain] kinase [Bertholletia excelsa]
MEVYGKQNLWQFIDDEQKNANLPRVLSLSAQESGSHPQTQFASPRLSNASTTTSYPQWPGSPGTPWTLSPVRTSPNPLLLYHCLASLHRHEGNILSITVSKDFIFTGSESRRIHVWGLPDCTEMGCIKAGSEKVKAMLGCGRLLFTSHGDCRIRVWDVSPAENFRARKMATLPPKNRFFMYPRRAAHQHKDLISCLAYNPAEKLLYTGSWDGTVKAWGVSERRCFDSFVAHDGHVNAIAVNQQDGCVFTCSDDGSVRIWRRVFTGAPHILTMTLKFQPSPVNALALTLCLDGCFLYSGSSDGLISFWEKERMSGRFNHGGILKGHQFSVLCLEAISDLILSGSEDATIRVWRREEGNTLHSCLTVIRGHQGPVRCLAVSLESEDPVMRLMVYSASLDQTLKAWRVKICREEKGAVSGESGVGGSQMSPVLSPSWVEKRLQGSHLYEDCKRKN